MSESPSRQMMAAGNLFADSFRYGLERYGSNRNRHWWGIAHRRWLVNSGRYIKTSQQRGMGLMQFIAGPLPEYKPIGEAGPELVNFRAPFYPPPHHRGSAADVEHHWPGCGHE